MAKRKKSPSKQRTSTARQPQKRRSKRRSTAKTGGGVKRPARPLGKVTIAVEFFDGLDADSAKIELAGRCQRAKSAPNPPSEGLIRQREQVVRQLSRGLKPDVVARNMAALSHPQRLRILLKLLAGEATHQLLRKTTDLKAGPLYHHLRELREVGFIGPKTRDLYVVTRAGRRAILGTLAMGRLCK